MGDRATRDHLGEEVFRGLDPPARRRGVSQRLANLKREFPSIRSLIRTEGEFLQFDASGCEIDVRRVIQVAERVREAKGGLADQLCAEARQALALAAHEFLPAWESIESRGTLRGSGATELVTDVREQVTMARLDILSGLADAALARREADDAIAYLEVALSLRPERISLARRLADMYAGNGHQQRADRLRREYGLDEAS